MKGMTVLRIGRRLVSTMVKRSPAKRVQSTTPSIWVEFTTLAAECKAVNLGQGFPDTPMPKFVAEKLKEVANQPERTDMHQYTRGYGNPKLVSVLGKLYSKLYGLPIDANNQIVVTVGAYLALYYAFLGWIDHGDEVIILEPAYDCYSPQVKFAGGTPVPVVMPLKKDASSSADYVLDAEAVRKAVTSKTKMIVLNNPHNPTGKLFSRAELEAVAKIAEEHDLIVIADEVYEWHVYEGKEMIRFASLPGMFDRTISIGSAGKAFSVTGWKLGWAIGPDHLLAPIKAVHQNCVFTCSTPTQHAVAEAMEDELKIMDDHPEKSYLRTGLSSELVAKRDRLTSMVREAGMTPIVPESGYFMMAGFKGYHGPFESDLSPDPLDFRFVRWLCREKKLATIPPSAFYSPQFKKDNEHMVRLCFFKSDDTLSKAEAILKELKKEMSGGAN
ncbi:hypothetical protein PMAYCL1PPCAC_02149 [Pristionchus mayeri]|uniref:Aminotransferase class I/classII large domain-containing protein n=1 Tax=Pristionchus mayeri TaxID=1317129 RepID=A0AAN5C7N6_9BILA|nr:hypothetical protein PMAYCL1PPCAC_02149 [Pristionchus mayeri]